MPETLKLAVNGMHCDGCVRRLTAALETLPGVEVDSVEVGSAKVTFNPAQSAAPAILAEVNRIGFSASVEE